VTAPSESSPERGNGGSTPDVSAIVIGHSVRHELGPCLDSLREHADGVAAEVFVVDNASEDGTAEWVRREHPEVELIALEENVFGIARNRALPRVRGRHTLFLDSDAVLTPGALPTMVEALDRNETWGLVGPRLTYPDGGLQLSCRRFPPRAIPIMRRPPLSAFLEQSEPVRRHQMEDIDHDRGRPVLYVLGACQLFRTSIAARIGDLDARLGWGGEDIDWCVRVWDTGAEVRYLPEATVIHSYRRQSKQAPFSAKALRHLRSFTALQWKYRRRYRELMRFGDELDARAPA